MLMVTLKAQGNFTNICWGSVEFWVLEVFRILALSSIFQVSLQKLEGLLTTGTGLKDYDI